MKTNFHTHNYRCGHAVGNVEDYVKVAIEEGYTELGISDHAPLPAYYFDRMKMEDLENYLEEIEKSQNKYGKQIKIYKSLEIEYFPEFQSYYDELRNKLDYIILGLHAFRKNEEDKNKIYNAWTIKNEEDIIFYAKYMAEAIKTGNFDYVAHPDLYMINYRKWTAACVEAAHIICKAAEEMDLPLEVNANGIRKTLERYPEWDRYMYPYKEFWEIVRQYNIRTIIGSDTHNYNEMEDEPMEMARKFAEELNLKVIETMF
ncbi:histidinol-phosphatase HisJ family protein [Leptotrichia sp. OH3620_COT-345]|uniref:histidinol-phosphatase n=1 Tax=Leptotrichia sp. OH3620_COT-345 TaxID=2491048 RepID=UPI000F64A0DB|nr:histidinol-phosphatase [Leptotrichia sp. OH3620_COT-345]RRD39520.1 histidinol-phosphatase HisJ family protein [Leptotrichia sp. OH3620_COT-345]